MAELIPRDRLQPALLDRLVNSEPDKKDETREQRLVSRKQLHEAVLRDLAWLFNTTRLGDEAAFAGCEQALHSVINYGLPPLSGQTVSKLDLPGLERAMRQAIFDYEPRIIPASLQVRALNTQPLLDQHNVISMEIRGSLWAQPVPLELLLRTEVDLETGACEIRNLGDTP